MMTPHRPRSRFHRLLRGASFPHTTLQPDQEADRTISPAGKAGARRLPDFSIFIPRDPFAALSERVPASTLRRSGFVL
jgi:hypothetical protein